MSKEILKTSNGVYVTQFATETGTAFQVTWGWRDGEDVVLENKTDAIIVAVSMNNIVPMMIDTPFLLLAQL